MAKYYSLKGTAQWYLYGKKHFTQTGYENAAKNFANPDTEMDVNLTGKNFVVTGANSGLGFQLTKFFASKGGTVYMVCRNQQRAQKALESVQEETKDAKLHLLIGDLTIKGDIEKVAKEFGEIADKIDCLVINAGLCLEEKSLTKEGLEVTFACHLLYGCYYMNKLLLPFIKKGTDPRVMIVTSGGMYPFKLPPFPYVAGEKGIYVGVRQYGYCKRAQVLLAERWAEENKDVTFVTAHPGWAMTEGIERGLNDLAKKFEPYRTAWQGTEGIAWCCVVAGNKLQTGGLYLDRRVETKHMAGPFFTEGSFTKNSKEEVDELTKKLEEYLVNPVVQTTRPVVGDGLLLLTSEQIKASECQTCKEKVKNPKYCRVCGEAQCSTCIGSKVQGAPACGRCFKQSFAIGEQKEAIHDEFMSDVVAFSLDTQSWKAQKPIKGHQVFSRDMPGTKVKAFKVIRTMKCSMASIDQLLNEQYLERHGDWNDTFKEGRTIKQIDNDNSIQYMRFSSKLISDREFVIASRRELRDDGSLLKIERSIVTSEQPVQSKIIRADMPFHVRLFTEVGEGELEYLDVNMTDMGGWLPTGAVNNANAAVTSDEMEQIEVQAQLIDNTLKIVKTKLQN